MRILLLLLFAFEYYFYRFFLSDNNKLFVSLFCFVLIHQINYNNRVIQFIIANS
jgi:hypothetical protein